ncbi:endonuclease domain-containing protein [bacterium]|nr:endonuclease domain-containing protein [bacterium]
MQKYSKHLKEYARSLRSNLTDSEKKLWSKLRGKQLHGVLFYRQKPLGQYIVDFHAPRAGLVIEIDGSQHLDPAHNEEDRQRDASLKAKGLEVLRFDSRQVLLELDAVVQEIARQVEMRLVSG